MRNIKSNRKSNLLFKVGTWILGLSMIGVSFSSVAFGQATSTTATSTNTTATSTNSTGTTTAPLTVRVMLHLCDSEIKNTGDMIGLERRFATSGNINNATSSINSGLTSSISAFETIEANCSVTVLPKDNPQIGTLMSPSTLFDFTLKSQNETLLKHITDATFEPARICGSSFIAADPSSTGVGVDTCLDASMYSWTINPTSNIIVVSEVAPPNGFHFGSVLFTPNALINNNDASSSLSVLNTSNGGADISLNIASDSDRIITLHVFNFMNSSTSTATTTSGTATTTGVTATTTTGTATSTNTGTNTNVNTNTSTSTTTCTVPMIISGQSLSGTVGQSMSLQLMSSSTGSTINTTFSLGSSSLPSGLFFSPSSGIISGTPTLSGSFPVSIVSSNSCGMSTTTLIFNIATGTSVTNNTGNNISTTSTGTITNLLSASSTLNEAAINAIVNIIQRVEDIQAQILNIVGQLIAKM